jgi:hypothetical protein
MDTNENTYGPAVAMAIIVVILFFGGWYIFIGQNFKDPTSEATVMPEISTSTNPIVYGTSTENVDGNLMASTSETITN